MLGRGRDAPVGGEVGEVLSDFVRAHLRGVALALKDDEALDALDVGRFGANAIMLEAQNASDLFEQRGLFGHGAFSADEVFGWGGRADYVPGRIKAKPAGALCRGIR